MPETTKPLETGRARGLWKVPAAVSLLTLVNVVTFWPHYLGRSQFPWDFPLAYYGFTGYWTSAVSHGISPEWVPYAHMGYPLFSNLQSGIGYPPFWIFPALRIDYTLHAAVVFQALHVLFGAFGAFALGRKLFGAGVAALLLGVAYHFFGGFYCNAQHPDIVRAFAWLPWLLLSAFIAPGQTRMEPRNLFLPLVVMLHVTGSYPGNVASHLLVAGAFAAACFVPQPRPRWWLLPALLGLVVLGIVMSAPGLLPGWNMRELLIRSGEANPYVMNWPLANWVYLILPWRNETPHLHDISMVSAAIPIPALVFLCFARRRDLARLAPFIVVALTALAFLPGDASRIARRVHRLVSVLALSRFPSSDFRAPLALALLVLGAAGLHGLASRTPEDRVFPRARIAGPLAIFFFFLTGQAGFRVLFIDVLVIGACIGASLLGAKGLLATSARVRTASSFLLVGLTLASGAYVVETSDFTWDTHGVRSFYRAGIGFSPDNELPVVARRFTHTLRTRPARHDTPNLYDFAWRGYLDGSFEMRDLTNTQFFGHRHIHTIPALHDFMARAWEARVLDGRLPEREACAALERELWSGNPPSSSVTPARYGVNTVELDVNLAETSYVVENETYFPGWRAELVAPDGETLGTRAPSAVCEGIRMWKLPRGRYRLRERYETPLLALSLRIALGAVLAYAALVLLAVRTASARSKQGEAT